MMIQQKRALFSTLPKYLLYLLNNLTLIFMLVIKTFICFPVNYSIEDAVAVYKFIGIETHQAFSIPIFIGSFEGCEREYERWG